MGGNAFGEHGLSTPRMPPAVYHFALKQTEEALSTLFPKVTHAIEGPGKKDYGDLDVLVLPDFGRPMPSLDDVSVLLGAKKSYASPSRVFMLAVPWPSKSNTSTSSITNASATDTTLLSADPGQNQNVQLYIQLDLRICTSQQDLTWRLFYHAHGDLINILSSIIRHKGLTITDQALYLRIHDLEIHNKKLARVELTHHPNQVLDYLGLDPSRFYHPFWSLTDMMSYIATCRFHDPTRVNSADTTVLDREHVTRTTLNSYDNERLTTRPIFRFWYNTYLPTHTTDTPGSSAHLSRERTVQDVFTFFGPELQRRYETQEAQHTTTVERGRLWHNIRDKILVANPDISKFDLNDILKALKREIIPAPSPDPSNIRLTPLQTLYTQNAFQTLIDQAVEHHTASLTRYRAWLVRNRSSPLDTRKTNPYSASELEVYTTEDNDTLLRMKGEDATWSEVLDALGKKSRNQLVARWKDLRKREGMDVEVGMGKGEETLSHTVEVSFA